MSSPLPPDYHERVYAGVLGKIIGVYLGRPFEQWSHEAIVERWGEIRRYVHADCGVPLVISDDDITGTFTFMRALADHPGAGAGLTSRQIGQTWLNYIAENRHILWWGGMGVSTEHTAFLRLRAGFPAPESGSLAHNGRAVAEEIGAQIFIDGWALVSPGWPEQAVRLAREAARVSHDGAAVDAAVMLAAMEAMAFVEADIPALIARGLEFIPPDGEIARIVADLRAWHGEGAGWGETFRRLRDRYGYPRYGTNCPVQPNFGIILLALLHGGGDFGESLMIANTAGYDTDCNSGNVGCLLGIRGGLAALSAGAYDWRTPVNDRLYLPAADGHRGVSDAATVACEVINLGRRLAGREGFAPKGGARYHFDLPGATHGFTAPSGSTPPHADTTPRGERALVLTAPDGDRSAYAEVATFLLPDALLMTGYALAATPALYPGQEIVAELTAGEAEGSARLFVRAYQEATGLRTWEGPWRTLRGGEDAALQWEVPPVDGWPVAAVGVEWRAPVGQSLFLRSLTWSGQPEMTLAAPVAEGEITPWLQSFVHDLDVFAPRWLAPFNLAKNRGTGIAHTGARDWRDYEVAAELKPVLGDDLGPGRPGAGPDALPRPDCHARRPPAAGARLPRGNRARGDGAGLDAGPDAALVAGHARPPPDRARSDGQIVLEAEDVDSLLDGGGAGWRVTTGRLESGPLEVRMAV